MKLVKMYNPPLKVRFRGRDLELIRVERRKKTYYAVVLFHGTEQRIGYQFLARYNSNMDPLWKL